MRKNIANIKKFVGFYLRALILNSNIKFIHNEIIQFI
jgi:hypothetical protein